MVGKDGKGNLRQGTGKRQHRFGPAVLCDFLRALYNAGFYCIRFYCLVAIPRFSRRRLPVFSSSARAGAKSGSVVSRGRLNGDFPSQRDQVIRFTGYRQIGGGERIPRLNDHAQQRRGPNPGRGGCVRRPIESSSFASSASGKDERDGGVVVTVVGQTSTPHHHQTPGGTAPGGRDLSARERDRGKGGLANREQGSSAPHREAAACTRDSTWE